MKKVIAALIVGSLSAVVLTGCAAQGPQVLLLTQDAAAAKLVSIESNTEGDLGHEYVFESPMLKDGKPYGEMFGTMTKVGELGHGTHPDAEDRLLNSVFDLPDGEIVVVGLSFYMPSSPALSKGEPVARAIVGGTGAYAGIRGEVITTHNADDTYTQEIRYWK
jgi:hypothetical protein